MNSVLPSTPLQPHRMHSPLRILVVGYGRMGNAHTQAYRNLPGFEVVGVVQHASAATTLPDDLPAFTDYAESLRITKPDAVSINTYPDTHAAYALMAFDAGAHVFVEKPLATTLPDAEAVISRAHATQRTLLVGYLLQHHPAYDHWLTEAKNLGKPLVMRMSLNQQSSGATWRKQRQLLAFGSPLLDSGVHYIDLMLAAADGAHPVRVQAIGARLSEAIAPDTFNYGQLQIFFSDGSIGWIESAYGPMLSQSAKDLRDIVGPKGSITLQHTHHGLHFHKHLAALNEQGQFANEDTTLLWENEPTHADLCRAEQAFFLRAIQEKLDLSQHHNRALQSLKVALAAEASLRSGKPVDLP